jgi:uncharacterized protein YegP (UPF0339 family)
MLHIVKQKTGFAVISLSSNGEVLQTSEILTTKASCWKNIRAMMESCFSTVTVYVQDDTPKTAIIYQFYTNGKKDKLVGYPEKKYVPGKNPLKKKRGG